MVQDMASHATQNPLTQTMVAVATHDQKIGAQVDGFAHQGRPNGLAVDVDHAAFAADVMPSEVVRRTLGTFGDRT